MISIHHHVHPAREEDSDGDPTQRSSAACLLNITRFNVLYKKVVITKCLDFGRKIFVEAVTVDLKAL